MAMFLQVPRLPRASSSSSRPFSTFASYPLRRKPARFTPKILVRRAWRSVGWCEAEGLPDLRPDPGLLIPQALCFAALGILLMIMSLSFIIMDWVSGTSRQLEEATRMTPASPLCSPSVLLPRLLSPCSHLVASWWGGRKAC